MFWRFICLLAAALALSMSLAQSAPGDMSGHWQRTACNCSGAASYGFAQCDDLWFLDYPAVSSGPVPGAFSQQCPATEQYSSNVSYPSSPQTLAMAYCRIPNVTGWQLFPYPRPPKVMSTSGYACTGPLGLGPLQCTDRYYTSVVLCTVTFTCVTGPCSTTLAALRANASTNANTWHWLLIIVTLTKLVL